MRGIPATSIGECIEEAIERIVQDCLKEPTESERRICVRAAIGDLFGCIARIHRREVRRQLQELSIRGRGHALGRVSTGDTG